jgi:hypothetical protein
MRDFFCTKLRRRIFFYVTPMLIINGKKNPVFENYLKSQIATSNFKPL